MPAEEVQERGRVGVGMVKAWLESTTWIDLPMNAYEDAPRCIVEHHAGIKRFDLRGHFLGSERPELSVECKRYATPGKQFEEFKHFLCIAYSATHKKIQTHGSWDERFLWVTSHPFNLRGWENQADHNAMISALEDHPEYLGGHPIDVDLAREVADRVWVLVFAEEQVNLSLSVAELGQVMATLDRKGNALWNR